MQKIKANKTCLKNEASFLQSFALKVVKLGQYHLMNEKAAKPSTEERLRKTTNYSHNALRT